MITWSVRVEILPYETGRKEESVFLGKIAAEGWEPYAVIVNALHGQVVYYFKRPGMPMDLGAGRL